MSDNDNSLELLDKTRKMVIENADNAPLLVGLGEALIRLSAPNYAPLSTSNELTMGVGGAELNVLVAARALGLRSRWLTRLAANDLGQMMRRHARSYDVEVVAANEEEARAGVFFYEFGVPPRPSRVIYDRRDSAMSHVDANEFDWPDVLEGAGGAHVTGITCALGKGPLEAALAFLRSAKDLGVCTSFDMNYRSQLWSVDDARAAYSAVLPFVDVLFASHRDMALLQGTSETDVDAAQKVKDQFHIQTLVLRERTELSGTELSVSVRVFGDDESSSQAGGVVIDEVGAGDAAVGAFLASTLVGEDNQTCTQRAARAYARMLTIPGDTWTGTLNDLTDDYVASRTVKR
jgi:2-dehydro-3-deoxygluconokinase